MSLAVALALSVPVSGFGAVGGAFLNHVVVATNKAAAVRAHSSLIQSAEPESRTYASNATGALRAQGRTEDSVRALTDAARTATSTRTFGELVGATSVPDTVHVAQFGAYGDGVHDDRAALQAAFDSGAKTILFERGATYKVNASLKISHGNITVLGDAATIQTDAEYNDSDERLLSIGGNVPQRDERAAVADDWEHHPEYLIADVGVFQLNMKACAYDPTHAVAGKAAYNMQLMLQMASNVDIFGCAFTIERPENGLAVDGCTSLDAYTGWHDVTVENCVVRNFCDKEGGGGIWIRDHFNMGASNMVCARNDFEKVCHDEILAVFNSNVNENAQTARPVADVLIAENKFVLGEATASPSVMAFTVKCARDVLIENNDMNVKTTGGLVWADHSAGVVVRDNDVTQVRSHVSGATNFLMFRDTVDLVEGNRMKLSALDEGPAVNDVYVFATGGAVRGNMVVSDMPLSYVASGSPTVEGNDVRLNARVHVVFNGNQNVSANKIELNEHADTYFQYFRTKFTNDAAISGNVFDNKVAGDTHTVLMLNDATMNGHVVRFMENKLVNSDLGKGARLLFLKLLDESAQENCVVFSGNDILDLKAYGVYCPDSRHTYQLQADDGNDSNLARVKNAVASAKAYLTERGMGAPAFADAVSHVQGDIRCYSVADGRYYLTCGDGCYSYDTSSGAVTAVTAGDRLPAYSTLAAAESAAGSLGNAFVTSGLASEGDGGHGYYARVDSLAAGQPGVVVGGISYALSSAESAVNVYQLGYVAEAASSVNAAIDAFHGSGFHTLVFPSGAYRLTADVYSRYDNRSYYGFDATLFTDSAVELGARNAAHKSIWVVRGDIEWGKGAETYEATNDDGTKSTKKKDVFHTVRNVELNGIKLERRSGTTGYNRAISVRSARGVTFRNCVIDGGEYVSGAATSTNGAIVDFYGDYADVSVINCSIEGEAGIDIRDLCNHVNNIPESMQVDADYPTGARNIVVRDSSITTHNFDEGLPIFAGNEQGLTNSAGEEYAILKNCLVEHVRVENNRYTMLKPATEKQRVVSITCGYQDSPVRNARIENNVFDVYANNYVILFGWAEDCRFANNDVTFRTTKAEAKIVPVIRSTHSRTGPTKNVVVEDNTMRFPDEDATVVRMVDNAFGAEAVTFTRNDMTVAGSVERVFDSTATSTDNTFHLNKVKRLYDRVGEVARNVYDINTLTGLYESYGTDAQADMNIHDEEAHIGEVTSNLLSFNGTPSYNGHSLTFTNCSYDIETVSKSYPRIASGTSAIVDGLSLSFTNCYLPHFDSGGAATVENNDSGKVTFAMTDCDHEHVWSTPVYTWADDNATVTAKRTCSGGPSHSQSETVTARRVVMSEPTCTERGEAVWASAEFANSAFTAQSKDEAIDALGHADDGGKVTREATADADGEITHTCTRCGAVLNVVAIPKTGATVDPPVVEPPTSDEPPTGDEQPSTGDDPGSDTPSGDTTGDDTPSAEPADDTPSDESSTGDESASSEPADDTASGDEDDSSDDAPISYEIILNPDGTWSGAQAGYTFSSNADISKFVCVLVDGDVLDPSCYDVKSGSTKVTLLADYLETLEPGVHEATIRSTDGEASTTFTVQEAAAEEDPEADDLEEVASDETPEAQKTSPTAKSSNKATADKSVPQSLPGAVPNTGDAALLAALIVAVLSLAISTIVLATKR